MSADSATLPAPAAASSLPFMNLPMRQRVGLLIAVAASIAALAVAVLWAREPDYRVLFSNVSDKDGGAIIATLTQQNIPYKYSEGGGAILVPADKVHDLRLKLASQGLPKGGIVGFELMEGQKFGITQFQEQVNFQRGLEGELARSIQTLAGVQQARVHLAIPRQTAFLREQDKPRASVLVTLAAGRTLDRSQVAGISHLVASSVPELALKNVSVVDQNGNLLSNAPDNTRLSAEQLSYVREIEAATIKRIEDILEPILGKDNVRAQVTADIDFSLSESTAETYKPNQEPGQAAVRSSRTSDAGSTNGSTAPAASGVPGAASNQPGVPAAAPTTSGTGGNNRREAAVNYEVDKTTRVTRATPGNIKRLTAAVVVNHRKVTANGQTTATPLTADEVTQLNALVKEAMGYQQGRGDSLNLVNTAFTQIEAPVQPEVPIWKQPDNIAMAKEAAKYLGLMLLAFFIWRSILRPALKQVMPEPKPTQPLEIPVDGEAGAHAELLPPEAAAQAANGPAGVLAVQNGVLQVRQLAKSDPKIVANVVKTWVSGNE